MKLLYTNILIYAAETQYSMLLLPYVTDPDNIVSVISKVETLGFHRITPAQIRYFENLFKILKTAPVDDAIIDKAIELRQQKKMSLGDSLLAATALVLDIELISRNTADFSGISGLMATNPLPVV